MPHKSKPGKTWSEALLRNESIYQCQTFQQDEKLLYKLNVGKFLPQYKNAMAQQQWEKSLSTVQTFRDLNQHENTLPPTPSLRKYNSEKLTGQAEKGERES